MIQELRKVRHHAWLSTNNRLHDIEAHKILDVLYKACKNDTPKTINGTYIQSKHFHQYQEIAQVRNLRRITKKRKNTRAGQIAERWKTRKNWVMVVCSKLFFDTPPHTLSTTFRPLCLFRLYKLLTEDRTV